MKIKIKNVSRGDIILNETAIPAGRTVEVDETVLLPYKDHPALKEYFDTGKLVAGEALEELMERENAEAEANRANAEASPDDRTAAIAEVIKNLDKDTGFLADGRPRVEAINASLPSGTDPVGAEERDSVWAKVQTGEA